MSKPFHNNGIIQGSEQKMAKEYSQEHIVKICLPPELYLAVTKFQMQKEISRFYAGLLLITKATYQEQLITKEVYEKYLYRYSRKLVAAVLRFRSAVRRLQWPSGDDQARLGYRSPKL